MISSLSTRRCNALDSSVFMTTRTQYPRHVPPDLMRRSDDAPGTRLCSTIGNLSKAWHRNGTELGVAHSSWTDQSNQGNRRVSPGALNRGLGNPSGSPSMPVAPADGKPARSKTRALDASPLASSATSHEASD